MKILTAALLCVIGGIAYAGPKVEMKQVVPVADCPNWTGFYIGGFAGYKYDVADTHMNLSGQWLNTQLSDLHNNADMNTSGMELGGLIGYNYEFQSHWVLGLETDAAYLWLGKQGVTGRVVESDYYVNTSLKTHYLVTVGPRIGYAFCKWFPYVTGGLAIGDIDLNQNLDGEFQSGHTNPVKAGWMVGAGVQYAITSHWSTRLQYEFIDLGTASCTSSFLSQYPDYTANHSASLHEHNISVAIIYGF